MLGYGVGRRTQKRSNLGIPKADGVEQNSFVLIGLLANRFEHQDGKQLLGARGASGLASLVGYSSLFLCRHSSPSPADAFYCGEFY